MANALEESALRFERRMAERSLAIMKGELRSENGQFSGAEKEAVQGLAAKQASQTKSFCEQDDHILLILHPTNFVGWMVKDDGLILLTAGMLDNGATPAAFFIFETFEEALENLSWALFEIEGAVKGADHLPDTAVRN